MAVAPTTDDASAQAPLLPNGRARGVERAHSRRAPSRLRPRGSEAGHAAVAHPPKAARPDWWGAGRVRRDWLVSVVGLEVVALVVAVLVAQGRRWFLIIALPAVVVLLVLVAARVRRRWVPLWVAVAIAYRRRRRRMAAAAGHGVAAVDTLVDGAQLTSFADRTGMTFGVLRSGRVWSLTMAVEAGHGEVLAAAPTERLPLQALAWVLHERDIDLHEARLVVHQAGAQARVPAACRRRLVWVSLSIDPRRCPAAVEARGGGTTGSLRALTTQAARLAVRCSDIGVRLVPLDTEHLRSALALSAQAPLSPQQPGGPAVDYTEAWRGWNGGHLTHATFWLERLPRGAGIEDVLDVLSGLPVESLTVSLAVRSAAGRVNQRVLVRIGCLPADCDRLRAEFAETLQRYGLRGVPLDGQQVLGVRATLPVVLSS